MRAQMVPEYSLTAFANIIMFAVTSGHGQCLFPRTALAYEFVNLSHGYKEVVAFREHASLVDCCVPIILNIVIFFLTVFWLTRLCLSQRRKDMQAVIING